MATLWAKQHGCATCEYWEGSRQVRSDPRVVECRTSELGICTGANNSHRGRKVSAGTIPGGKCWRCWHCLRER